MEIEAARRPAWRKPNGFPLKGGVRKRTGVRVRCNLQFFAKKIEGYKSERRMPWLLQAMKDVVSCEKLRGTANRF